MVFLKITLVYNLYKSLKITHGVKDIYFFFFFKFKLMFQSRIFIDNTIKNIGKLLCL